MSDALTKPSDDRRPVFCATISTGTGSTLFLYGVFSAASGDLASGGDSRGVSSFVIWLSCWAAFTMSEAGWLRSICSLRTMFA